MARISYFDESQHPEMADETARLKAGRDGKLLNIYKLLLHNPAIANSWFDHVGAVRWQTDLDGQTREIAIIRVALLNRLDYAFNQHVPRHTAPEGMSNELCHAIKDWEPSTLFDAKQRAVLAYADAMTLNVQVPEDVFDALKPHFNEKQILELTTLIGTYNMHTRVLSALQIDLE